MVGGWFISVKWSTRHTSATSIKGPYEEKQTFTLNHTDHTSAQERMRSETGKRNLYTETPTESC